MPGKRRLRIHPDLRFADLKRRVPRGVRVKNVRVPAEVVEAVRRVAERLEVTNMELVTALLNHGLEVVSVALEKADLQVEASGQRALLKRFRLASPRSKSTP